MRIRGQPPQVEKVFSPLKNQPQRTQELADSFPSSREVKEAFIVTPSETRAKVLSQSFHLESGWRTEDLEGVPMHLVRVNTTSN